MASPHQPSASPDPHADQIIRARHRLELELMHFWVVSTNMTVRSSDIEVLSFDVEVPRLALDHEYLLHAIFSLTSFHLASLNPEEAMDRVKDGVDYQVSASSLCRRTLSNMTANDVVAMFFCSALMGMLALGYHAVDRSGRSEPTPSDTVIQLSQLWRGTTGVLMAARDLVDQATIKVMFPTTPENRADHTPLPAPFSSAQTFIEKLRSRAASHLHYNAYQETIDRLQDGFRSVCHRSAPKMILGWMPIVPVVYMDHLAQREPLACAIALVYGVLLRELEQVWWAANFGKDLVEEMAPVVLAADPEWEEHIQWARAPQLLSSQVPTGCTFSEAKVEPSRPLNLKPRPEPGSLQMPTPTENT
nr:hypothetical protein CFP56_20362 [Quercus suber]